MSLGVSTYLPEQFLLVVAGTLWRVRGSSQWAVAACQLSVSSSSIQIKHVREIFWHETFCKSFRKTFLKNTGNIKVHAKSSRSFNKGSVWSVHYVHV